MYRYVLFVCHNRTAAEDIVQSTFLKAMTAITNFRGECSIKTWLFTIARHESINYNKAQTDTVPFEHIPEFTVSCSGDYSEQFSQKETVDFILDYISKCEEPKKSLIAFRLVEELPFAEIAGILGKSETWCRVTFFRLKEDLVKQLEVLV